MIENMYGNIYKRPIFSVLIKNEEMEKIIAIWFLSDNCIG